MIVATSKLENADEAVVSITIEATVKEWRDFCDQVSADTSNAYPKWKIVDVIQKATHKVVRAHNAITVESEV